MRRNLSVLLILAVVVATGAVAGVAGQTRGDHEFGQRISANSGMPPGRSKPATDRTITTANCTDVKPNNAYRFIEGVDLCLQLRSEADLAQLQDPFAVNVLQKGIGQSRLWPSGVEGIVSILSAVPGFNQQTYLVGEGSQITANVVSRDASRNLRYVITWGTGSSPLVFLSAAPTGTHPGLPAPFLQLIGYDQKKNVFNYYQYISNGDVSTSLKGATRTWVWMGDSTWSRNMLSAGQGCFACHINGART